MTDFPSSVLSFILQSQASRYKGTNNDYICKILGNDEGVSICTEKEKSLRIQGQETVIYIMNMAKRPIKKQDLDGQKKNHIGFTPRHQAHPWKILMCQNITVCTFPRARISAIFGFPTYTWNMKFFFSDRIRVPFMFNTCMQPRVSKKDFLYVGMNCLTI